jgi:hypothetical protein
MNFALSPDFSTSIDAMDSKGTYLRYKQLVADSFFRGVYYYRSPINPTTGTLGGLVYFWGDDDYSNAESSVFSDSLTAQLNALGAPNATIMIARNGTSLFTCSQSMLALCGDSIQQIWMHSSGAYLFAYDYTLNETPILYINLPLQKLVASGAAIPGQPDQMAFSKDGLLVYAVEGSQILTYVFNPHSGLLTARTIINAPGVLSILPWV